MTIEPRYAFKSGTSLNVNSMRLVVRKVTSEGYELVSEDDGTTRWMTLQSMSEILKLPQVRIASTQTEQSVTAVNRLKTVVTSKSLPETQQDTAKFRLCLCIAIDQLVQKTRQETGDISFDVTGPFLDLKESRQFISNVASAHFGCKIHISSSPGGKRTSWHMYRGRRLRDHYLKYLKAKECPDIDPLDLLAPLDHLKGNRTARLHWVVLEIMTEVWDKGGLSLTNLLLQNNHTRLNDEIRLLNIEREQNGLSLLPVPSAATLKAHRESLISETEYCVATQGFKEARNRRGRGSTDYRALLIGEYLEIDECKISLVACAKARGMWSKMDDEQKRALKQIDDDICARFTLILIIDVATRMPLAWVLTENPNAEATLEALRMATRDKSREKHQFSCNLDPMRAVGIGHLKNDNGTGLRNKQVKTAAMGMGITNTDVRAHAATDKPYVERLFGTTESAFFKVIEGYTGRKPGELPGYDSVRSAMLVHDELYAEISRFFIDEYPAMRHYGFGMFGRRPIEVAKEINALRGCWPVQDPNKRRIHLGWKSQSQITDEGVRAFEGIWFSSGELQDLDWREGKVDIYIDPDDLNVATVVVPRHEPIPVELQATAFSGMSLPEVLHLMTTAKQEDPQQTKFYEDHLSKHRMDRRDRFNRLARERKIPRSYMTIAEAKKRAKEVFAGARVVPKGTIEGAIALQDITTFDETEDDMLVDGTAVVPPREPETAKTAQRTPRKTVTPSIEKDRLPAKASTSEQKQDENSSPVFIPRSKKRKVLE